MRVRYVDFDRLVRVYIMQQNTSISREIYFIYFILSKNICLLNEKKNNKNSRWI